MSSCVGFFGCTLFPYPTSMYRPREVWSNSRLWSGIITEIEVLSKENHTYLKVEGRVVELVFSISKKIKVNITTADIRFVFHFWFVSLFNMGRTTPIQWFCSMHYAKKFICWCLVFWRHLFYQTNSKYFFFFNWFNLRSLWLCIWSAVNAHRSGCTPPFLWLILAVFIGKQETIF